MCRYLAWSLNCDNDLTCLGEQCPLCVWEHCCCCVYEDTFHTTEHCFQMAILRLTSLVALPDCRPLYGVQFFSLRRLLVRFSLGIGGCKEFTLPPIRPCLVLHHCQCAVLAFSECVSPLSGCVAGGSAV